MRTAYSLNLREAPSVTLLQRDGTQPRYIVRMKAPLQSMVRIQQPFVATQANQGIESSVLIAKLIAGPDWCTKFEFFIDCSDYSIQQLLRRQRVHVPLGSPVHSVPETAQTTVARRAT
jgi:hypothetical protein